MNRIEVATTSIDYNDLGYESCVKVMLKLSKIWFARK